MTHIQVEIMCTARTIFWIFMNSQLAYLLICTTFICICRQYYVFVTDARCKRVGTQCWVLGAITATEAIICCKFGRKLLGQAQVKNIILWLLVQLALSVACVTGCVIIYNIRERFKDKGGEATKTKTS